MPPPPRIGLDEMVSRLERTLASSPADATEIAWIDARRAQESNGKRRRDSYEQQETTVFVRVRESGRYGFHRTEVAEPADLANAVRSALAQARLSQPVPAALRPEGAAEPVTLASEIHDPEIARLTSARARELVQGMAGQEETVRLGWAEGRVALADSRGLRRAAEVTSAWAGIASGTGMASAASRSLAGLGLSLLLARARDRQAPGEADPSALPDGPIRVVLSQESAAALLDLLNRRALTSTSFHQGTSCLRDFLGAPVFHPAVSLRDDGTDPRGLPFPFDLLGSARRPIDLIAGGVFLTPAVDDRLARKLDRLPTPHLVAPDEAAASHLFLVPGEVPDEQLLGNSDGGLWIAALDPLESYNPRTLPNTLRFRAVARGVRRIEDGRLGTALPDLVWEDDLRNLLSGPLAIGAEPVTLGESLFGGITTPILAFEQASGLRPA
jgi:PmbA protein